MNGWKKWIAPAIVIPAFITLIVCGYNSIADDIKKNEDHIVDLQKEKVDNQTLMMLMQQMQKTNDAQLDQIKIQSQQVEKLLIELKKEKKDE